MCCSKQLHKVLLCMYHHDNKPMFRCFRVLFTRRPSEIIFIPEDPMELQSSRKNVPNEYEKRNNNNNWYLDSVLLVSYCFLAFHKSTHPKNHLDCYPLEIICSEFVFLKKLHEFKPKYKCSTVSFDSSALKIVFAVSFPSCLFPAN